MDFVKQLIEHLHIPIEGMQASVVATSIANDEHNEETGKLVDQGLVCFQSVVGTRCSGGEHRRSCSQMTRHSKNCTSGAFFTAAEKAKLGRFYGTQRERLGTESMRRADWCGICLHPVKGPVLCCDGCTPKPAERSNKAAGSETESLDGSIDWAHLYCRECVLAYILNQVKVIKAEAAQLEEDKINEQAKTKEMEASAARQKIIKFEATQTVSPNTLGQGAPESVSAKRDLLYSFEGVPNYERPLARNERRSKRKILCPGPGLCDHVITVKGLVNVVTPDEVVRCRLCLETAKNTVGFGVFVKCGHLTCNKCTVRAVRECPVCDTQIPENRRTSVVCDGTGFSASGSATIVGLKYRPAFI